MGWVINTTTRPLYPREAEPVPPYRRLGGFPQPGRFTPVKQNLYHRIGGWVGSTAGLEGCGKTRLLYDSISGPSSP